MSKYIKSEKKPIFDVTLEMLCKFRTSKAYLWGLIRYRLQQKADIDTSGSMTILDAACHSLITRNMFPDTYNYFGIDIALNRLKCANKIKKAGDQLYMGDLTQELHIDNCFSVVVSCNTMSHLPLEDQEKMLQNLIKCVHSGGDLIINATITEQLMRTTEIILKEFNKLEIVYFDSFLSHKQENKKEITEKNVARQTISNEFEIPNDACFHRQVILFASSRKTKNTRRQPPRTNDSTILKLNRVPLLESEQFENDEEIIAKYLNSDEYFLLTTKLWESNCGKRLAQCLQSNGNEVNQLQEKLQIASSIKKILILGLEENWMKDPTLDRIAINSIRGEENRIIRFLLVHSRDGRECKPSLVACDL